MDKQAKTEKSTLMLLLAGGAAAVLGLGAYFYFRKGSQGSSLSKSEKEKIIKNIKIEMLPGLAEILDIESISHIFEAITQFAAPGYNTLIQKERQIKRENFDKLEVYCQVCANYPHECAKVIDAATTEVLKALGITRESWVKSNNFYILQQVPEVINLHQTLSRKLLFTLKPQHSLTKEQLKPILREHAKILEDVGWNAKDFVPYIEGPADLVPVVTNRAHDIIFQKFGVEEEDILACMRENMQDLEIQQSILDYQMALSKMRRMFAGQGEPEEQIPIQFKENITEEEKQSLVQKLEIRMNGEFLIVPSIIEIMQVSLLFAFPKYVQIAREDRINRRKDINNFKAYAESWETFSAKVLQAIEDATKDVLARINVEYSVWEKSKQHYAEQKNQAIYMEQLNALEKLKSGVTSEKKMSAQEVKDAIRSSIEVAEEEINNIPSIKPHVKTPMDVFPIAQNHMSDVLFERLGVEDEDVLKNIEDCLDDPEIPEILMKFQEVAMRLRNICIQP